MAHAVSTITNIIILLSAWATGDYGGERDKVVVVLFLMVGQRGMKAAAGTVSGGVVSSTSHCYVAVVILVLTLLPPERPAG